MKKNKKELPEIIDNLEKLIIKIISLVGWVKILIDVLTKD